MPVQFPNGSAPCVIAGMSRRGPRGPGRFKSVMSAAPFYIGGITRDSTGAVLGGCTVNLFDTLTSALVQSTTSDAGGYYRFQICDGRQYYVVAYKAGSPDVAGTSVNTLVADNNG